MNLSTNEKVLKKLIKEAFNEFLIEQKKEIQEYIHGIGEDNALSRAVDEGMGTPPVSRDEIISRLDDKPGKPLSGNHFVKIPK
ncbi:MAG: hypothetical protein ACE15F_01030 [bacterium]